MLEFTFCMIVLLLMMYGMMMVFRWVGLDLAERRQSHERVLTQEITEERDAITKTLPPITIPKGEIL